MERVVEHDHRGTPGGRPRDLHGVLDRFGTGVHEQRLRLDAGLRPGLVEEPADLDVRLVHPDHEALVEIAVDLLVDRSRCEAVAGVLAPEPAGEVDVLATVDVPDPCAFGSRDDERCRCDSARDVACAVRENPLAFDCLFEARRHWRGSFH